MYKEQQLMDTIIIGIAGLMALFLTIVFVVKGALIVPAAAAVNRPRPGWYNRRREVSHAACGGGRAGRRARV